MASWGANEWREAYGIKANPPSGYKLSNTYYYTISSPEDQDQPSGVRAENENGVSIRRMSNSDWNAYNSDYIQFKGINFPVNPDEGKVKGIKSQLTKESFTILRPLGKTLSIRPDGRGYTPPEVFTAYYSQALEADDAGTNTITADSRVTYKSQKDDCIIEIIFSTNEKDDLKDVKKGKKVRTLFEYVKDESAPKPERKPEAKPEPNPMGVMLSAATATTLITYLAYALNRRREKNEREEAEKLEILKEKK
jgi:hypothetical protein